MLDGMDEKKVLTAVRKIEKKLIGASPRECAKWTSRLVRLKLRLTGR